LKFVPLVTGRLEPKVVRVLKTALYIHIVYIMSVLSTRRNLNDWLTIHHSITLVDFQIDAQNSYLFIYNTFIKNLYMFRALPCLSSGGLRRKCIYTASGIVTL
jgi:hypothetical protein